jgi:hypothetical protein
MILNMFLLPIAILLVSYLMYIFFHKGKTKPIFGEKRNNTIDYFKDYFNYRLYWSYLILLIFGLIILLIVIVIVI